MKADIGEFEFVENVNVISPVYEKTLSFSKDYPSDVLIISVDEITSAIYCKKHIRPYLIKTWSKSWEAIHNAIREKYSLKGH